MPGAKNQTYKQLTAEIEKLQKQAQQVRKEEVAAVISRIQDAIKTYGLTAADLGLISAKPAKPSKAKKFASKSTGTAYSDGNGNTWGGRGPRPG